MRCYPILTSFKFHGAVIRAGKNGDPYVFVQMDEDEAQPYIDAGVISGEWVEAPSDEELEAERQAEADAAKAAADAQLADDVAAAERAAAEQAARDKAAAEKAASDQAAAVKAAAKKGAAKKATAKKSARAGQQGK